MKNLHYDQEKFEHILMSIINNQTELLNQETQKSALTLADLVHLEEKAKELASVIHDSLVIKSYSNVNFDVNWTVKIKHDQLPYIKLRISAVTSMDHYPFELSNQTVRHIKQYLLEHNEIPNVWEIS